MPAPSRKPARVKHIPQRTCVVCRNVQAKRGLIRLVRTSEGLQVDPSGKMAGRGAYLCENPTCWDKAAQSEVLNRALRMTITDEDRNRLRIYSAEIAEKVQKEGGK